MPRATSINTQEASSAVQCNADDSRSTRSLAIDLQQWKNRSSKFSIRCGIACDFVRPERWRSQIVWIAKHAHEQKLASLEHFYGEQGTGAWRCVCVCVCVCV